jgi:cytochrome c biogenesis protein CcdA
MEPLTLVNAFWLGLLTSVSPCPLATNVAAMTYIGRHVGNTRTVMNCGLAYTAGRILVYVALGIALTAGLNAIPAVANFLQTAMNKILGPLLVLIGLVLLEKITFRLPGGMNVQWLERLAAKGTMGGAALIGAFFALSFCPVSAALFFGSLIPLALTHHSPVFMPTIYGIGTGLPVVVFAIMIAFGTGSVGKAFDILSKVEWWVQRITGVVFIGVGGFYTLRYIFGVV